MLIISSQQIIKTEETNKVTVTHHHYLQVIEKKKCNSFDRGKDITLNRLKEFQCMVIKEMVLLPKCLLNNKIKLRATM